MSHPLNKNGNILFFDRDIGSIVRILPKLTDFGSACIASSQQFNASQEISQKEKQKPQSQQSQQSQSKCKDEELQLSFDANIGRGERILRRKLENERNEIEKEKQQEFEKEKQIKELKNENIGNKSQNIESGKTPSLFNNNNKFGGKQQIQSFNQLTISATPSTESNTTSSIQSSPSNNPFSSSPSLHMQNNTPQTNYQSFSYNFSSSSSSSQKQHNFYSPSIQIQIPPSSSSKAQTTPLPSPQTAFTNIHPSSIQNMNVNKQSYSNTHQRTPHVQINQQNVQYSPMQQQQLQQIHQQYQIQQQQQQQTPSVGSALSPSLKTAIQYQHQIQQTQLQIQLQQQQQMQQMQSKQQNQQQQQQFNQPITPSFKGMQQSPITPQQQQQLQQQLNQLAQQQHLAHLHVLSQGLSQDEDTMLPPQTLRSPHRQIFAPFQNMHISPPVVNVHNNNNNSNSNTPQINSYISTQQTIKLNETQQIVSVSQPNTNNSVNQTQNSQINQLPTPLTLKGLQQFFQLSSSNSTPQKQPSTSSSSQSSIIPIKSSQQPSLQSSSLSPTSQTQYTQQSRLKSTTPQSTSLSSTQSSSQHSKQILQIRPDLAGYIHELSGTPQFVSPEIYAANNSILNSKLDEIVINNNLKRMKVELIEDINIKQDQLKQSESQIFTSSNFITNKQQILKEQIFTKDISEVEIIKKQDIWALGVLLFFMLSGEYPFQDDDEYSELQNDQSNNQSSETEMMSVKNETDNDDIDDDTDDETDPSQIKRVKKKNDNKNNVGIERKKRRRIAVRKKQRLNLKKQKKNLAERIRDFDFDRDGAPILRNIWKINSQSNNTKFKEDSLSEDAFDLVKKLLSTNPSQRPSAEDALQHRWFDPIKLIMNEIEEKHQQKQIINHLSNTSKKSQNKTQQQFIITLQEKKLMRKGSRVAMEIPDISPTSSSQSTTFSFQNILNENNQAEEDGAIAVDDILIAYPILIPSLGQNSDSDWLRSRLHLQ